MVNTVNSTDDKITKTQILNNWINEHKTLPAQGTYEWLRDRKFRIGGSEVGIIEGCNPYQNKRDLIDTHLGITQFTGNIATRWGKILERVTETVLEQVFNCKNYVPGAIPHVSFAIHANSPDGIVYIPMWDSLVLLEIKNPIGRIPGNIVPKHYKPQLKSGLCVVTIADFALFADHQQRKCDISDLIPNNINYDINFHNNKSERISKQPLVLTMLGFYSINDPYTSNNDDNIIDYGTASKELFDDVLISVDETRICAIHYGDVYICNNVKPPPTPYEWRLQFITWCVENNHKPIGILPLKTFKLSIIPFYREPNYINNMEPKMNELVDIIRELDKLPQPEQINRLNKMFPSITQIETNNAAMRKNKHLM